MLILHTYRGDPRRHQTRALSCHVVAGVLCVFLAFFGQLAVADAPSTPRPNAGSLLDQATPPGVEPTLPASTLPSLLDEEVEENEAAAEKIKVSRFVIEGAKLLPLPELEAQLADLVGKDLSLAGLRKVAARITKIYREHGFFLARAYLPAQDIVDGVVYIAVLEGKYDGVELSGTTRLDEQHVQGILDAHKVSEGQPIERPAFERSLILLEQQSGREVQATLQPGATVGTSHMILEVPAGPLFSGQVGADNYGNHYSGKERATALLNLNSPRGVGDRASLWLMKSSGSDAVFAAYQSPVGYDGFTLGASYSHFDYQLCCEFSSADETGNAEVFGIQARYPLLLTQRAIANAGLSLERKHLTDTSTAGQLDDKYATVAGFSLDGVAVHWGGQNRYQVGFFAGDLDLSNNPGNAAQDAATVDTAGHYLKLRAEFEHLHPLANGTKLDIRLSGQWSNRNLDSSEAFLMGGNAAIRAYPEGQAPADEALLARIDWLIPVNFEQLPGSTTARLFYDTGTVWINQDTRGGLADPGGHNHYGLSGVGFGLGWSHPKGITATLEAATMIGSNPGSSANGDNADGNNNRSQVWLGVEWAF